MPATFSDAPGVTFYLYPAQVALDGNGQLLKSSAGSVYANGAATTPLAVRDLNGMALALQTDSQGIWPDFYAPGTNASPVLIDLGVRRIAVGSTEVPTLVANLATAATSAAAAQTSAAAAQTAAQAAAASAATSASAVAGGAAALVLNLNDPVPGGTVAGTIIYRRTT